MQNSDPPFVLIEKFLRPGPFEPVKKLAGDDFARNRNPFNCQAMESESIKKTGFRINLFIWLKSNYGLELESISFLCLGIGIKFIFCLGIGIQLLLDRKRPGPNDMSLKTLIENAVYVYSKDGTGDLTLDVPSFYITPVTSLGSALNLHTWTVWDIAWLSADACHLDKCLRLKSEIYHIDQVVSWWGHLTRCMTVTCSSAGIHLAKCMDWSLN